VLKRTGSLGWARQGVSAGSSLACALLIMTAYFVEGALPAVLLISVGAYFSAFAGPCAYSITIDMGGRHVPAVFSVMNMSGNLGAWLFPMAVPEVVAWTGEWEPVLFLFAGIYLLSALFWLLLDARGTVFTGKAGEQGA
jgi:nitrate/nitrite transporter NarK